MRTMVITGKGNLTVSPDTVIIRLPIEYSDTNYGTAVFYLNMQVERVRDCIEILGIDRKELKTHNFKVDTVYNWNKKTERNEFVGFKAKHDLILEIPFENTLVNKIINGIVELDSDIEFGISFVVKDKDACSIALLKNAISDAKKKAEVIANASGVHLKEIQNINYSFSDIFFHSETDLFYDSYENRHCDNYMADINPEDIKMNENVTVTWTIE